MKKVGGSFIADGSAVNVDIGFVPDSFRAWEGIEEGNPKIHYWRKDCANVSGSYGQYGFTNTAGTISTCASAAAGFASYDTVAQKVLLPAPNGEGEQAGDYPNSWTQARSSAATARSTTALGTTIRPTSGNETGYIYECTTAGTGSATEPTWPTTKGESVTDGSTVWITRDQKVKNIGAKGVTVGATLSTDSDQWLWEAEVWDSEAPERDAASYDPVGKHPNS
jgi:hypothetical protein